MKSIYLPRRAYARLVDAILKLEPDPVSGQVEADQVKLALGEFGDIWPEGLNELVDNSGEKPSLN